MKENIILLIFAGILFTCVMMNISLVIALLIGLILFLAYGFRTGHSANELFHMCITGIKDARNILITFVLIGMLTGMWRAAGTIPSIVNFSVVLIRPSVFLPVTFLLNAMISFLTGTALGSAATMGVICSVAGNSLGIPVYLIGGAVLSGVYFGDRCSPVSTSALLTAELTKTDIFENIKRMIKTAAVPFAVTCVLYIVIGLRVSHGGTVPDLGNLFSMEFQLGWIAVLPAAAVLVCSLFRVSVRPTLLVGVVTAIPIAYVMQGLSAMEIFKILLMGYEAKTPQLTNMISGGGITSMLKVSAIVLISSAYAGIFKETPLLNGFRGMVTKLAEKTTPMTAAAFSGTVTCAVACNQTLGIMLTKQLCDDIPQSREDAAINIENSAVLIAAIIPWSIACAVPLSSIGAPSLSVVFAFFLYLVPLWNMAVSLIRKPAA